jgi:HEPN domain-containing protein
MIRFRLLGRWVLPLLLVAACAQAPVQEMSDARQALQAARAVVEKEADVVRLQQAERTLREAESALEAGRYADARRQAEAAKTEAVEVRQRAAAD